MKKGIVTLTFFSLCLLGNAQQFIAPPKKIKTSSYDKISNYDSNGQHLNKLATDPNGTILDSVTIETIANKLPVFGVFGAGNLNEEQLSKFNASGKFSCFIRPIIKDKSNLTLYLSFNRNASNDDSLLAPTLLFPEVGNNSFLGTVEYALLFSAKDKTNNEHFIAPFFEFSHKNIKASQDTGDAKSTSFHFSSLNYTVGAKYLFHYNKSNDDEENNVYFSASAYLSYLNIPNQDTSDYRVLLKSATLKDNFWAAGLKLTVQYNNFSIFADLRHVLGSEQNIPVRELRGFNSNVGVVFSASIFKL